MNDNRILVLCDETSIRLKIMMVLAACNLGNFSIDFNDPTYLDFDDSWPEYDLVIYYTDSVWVDLAKPLVESSGDSPILLLGPFSQGMSRFLSDQSRIHTAPGLMLEKQLANKILQILSNARFSV